MFTASEPSRHLFFVYAPDKTEEGTLQRRLSVRLQHLESGKINMQKGSVRIAGMVTTPESIATPASEKMMVGSTFIMEGTTIEEIRKLVECDIYYTSGVWDKERLVILPFFPATPLL